MVNKKAQLKIQQMIFVLIAVTLFFVLVGLFIIAFKFADIKGMATKLEEENAILLVTELADAPEFSCGGAFSGSKSNCIDADKIMVLKDKEKYDGFWQVADIEIRKIYPKISGEVECALENYPDCNLIKVYSRNVNAGSYKSSFIALCRKEQHEGEVYDKCEIAKLLVSYEVKE